MMQNMIPGPEVIKVFSCSTQMRMKFNIYKQDNFRDQLSWAWKKFYNLGASVVSSLLSPIAS